jgi:hypothetical protein
VEAEPAVVPKRGQSENRFPLKVAPNFQIDRTLRSRLWPVRALFPQGRNEAFLKSRRKTMNDSVTTPAGNGTNKPSHVAYTVRDGKGTDKGFWTRMGVAWTSRDGKGLVIQLNAQPLDGKIILRVPDPKDNA